MLDEIQSKFAQNRFEFSRHTLDQSLHRHIRVQEIREAVIGCELIENYPNDKYGPSCLLLGRTATGRALHIQCSYPSRPLIKIITVYEPAPLKWENLRVRKAVDEK